MIIDDFLMILPALHHTLTRTTKTNYYAIATVCITSFKNVIFVGEGQMSFAVKARCHLHFADVILFPLEII